MADEETKPKRKAKDNPWYRLATLHGEPLDFNDEIAQKNRVTWNRWMAARISDELKTALREKGWSDDELTPFSEDELRCVEAQVGSPLEADEIDFSDTEFEAHFFAQGFVFPAINFGSAAFSGDAYFRSAAFSGDAVFDNAAFSTSTYASFGSATFSTYANFGGAAFSGYAVFDNAAFSGNANFAGVTFSDDTTFRSAIFSGPANFTDATFSDSALFASAKFNDRVNFGGVAFSGGAFLASVTFSGSANFTDATFSGHASFVNAEMKSVTIFTNVRFGIPPTFYGAKLHEGTTWRDVTWPAPPEDREQAGEYVEAYERLKLEMDRLKKHGDELDFFARELQSRRVLLGLWKGLPIAIYGFLSDYGRSYMRPLGLLVATVFLGAMIFASYEAGFWTPLLGYMRQAIGISFANTVSLLGKTLMRPDVALAEFPDWLKAVATIQTILGIVLLFLFGLGIRNRFRMK